MAATNFTIYKLLNDEDWQYIINQFNEEREDDKQFYQHTNRNNIAFNNITEYTLYSSAAETSPDWGVVMNELVSDLNGVTNTNQSYILFLRVEGLSFAVTGGYGYQVLERFKDYNFGLDLLSRLIGPNDNVIQKVNDRYFTGNILGGNYQLDKRMTINTEAEFNNFFEELYIALPRERIEEKLGLEIKSNKQDYRLLAKDSLKLGKSLTIHELDTLLGSVVSLLNEQGYDINPFYQLNDKDAIVDSLNYYLVEKFKDYLNGPFNDRDFSIIPYFKALDTHYIKINGDRKIRENYETENDIIHIFNKYVDLDKDNNDLLRIIRRTSLIGEIEGNMETEFSLYNHLDVSLRYDNNIYWLMNGNWYLIKRTFIEEINKHFFKKVTNEFDHNFRIGTMNSWPEGSGEGEYNFSHNEYSNVYVLDKITYRNIEICDLLIEENGKLYFVHVKDGLNTDARTLVSQIEDAMLILTDALRNDSRIIEEIYNVIISKKQDDDSSNESQQSRAAKKFHNAFPYVEDFISKLHYHADNINFVFAFRPLQSHDLNYPETIQSTAAKLSMIGMTETSKNFNFGLKFMRINRN